MPRQGVTTLKWCLVRHLIIMNTFGVKRIKKPLVAVYATCHECTIQTQLILVSKE